MVLTHAQRCLGMWSEVEVRSTDLDNLGSTGDMYTCDSEEITGKLQNIAKSLSSKNNIQFLKTMDCSFSIVKRADCYMICTAAKFRWKSEQVDHPFVTIHKNTTYIIRDKETTSNGPDTVPQVRKKTRSAWQTKIGNVEMRGDKKRGMFIGTNSHHRAKTSHTLSSNVSTASHSDFQSVRTSREVSERGVQSDGTSEHWNQPSTGLNRPRSMDPLGQSSLEMKDWSAAVSMIAPSAESFPHFATDKS